MKTCNGCVVLTLCGRLLTSVKVTLIPERNVEWHEGSIGKIQTQRHSVGLREPDRLPLSFDFSDE